MARLLPFTAKSIITAFFLVAQILPQKSQASPVPKIDTDEREQKVVATTTFEVKSSWWEGIPGETYIHKLNGTTNYYAHISSERPTFIMFYAEWCIHSKKAREAVAAAAKQLWMEEHPVAFAAVDCEVEREICENEYIDGYPTFFFFEKGELQKEFQLDGRISENFVSWITQVWRELQAEAQEQLDVTDDTPALTSAEADIVAGNIPESMELIYKRIKRN